MNVKVVNVLMFIKFVSKCKFKRFVNKVVIMLVIYVFNKGIFIFLFICVNVFGSKLLWFIVYEMWICLYIMIKRMVVILVIVLIVSSFVIVFLLMKCNVNVIGLEMFNCV